MRTLFGACAVLLSMLTIFPSAPAERLFPTSCHTAPQPLDYRQPDGSVLSIHAIGSAVHHYTETSDGYTVVRNNDMAYEYAVPGADGSLISSGIQAHNPEERSRSEERALRHVTKHLRMDAAAQAARMQQFESDPVYAAHREAEEFPAIGEHKVLVILIQYPDLPSQHSSAQFDGLMNAENYNGTGSFRDYYLKNSFGQLDLQADVFGWYTSAEGYEHYGFQNGFQRSRELMAEAIDAAEAAGVDFSLYDNDNDGVVDGVIGIHSGPGAEVGAQTQYIWSHRWTLGASYERNYDGVVISDYMINPETRPWGMVGVGVFCHEFGHMLGLPDLYDTDNSSSGIGNWGLMSKGAWLNLEKTPSNLNAWSKYVKNWIQPEVITSGVFSLQHSDGHAQCYRINTDDPAEYFLLENRQKEGNDAYLPGTGLAIWHIDEDVTATYPASNAVNADETNYGVDLEEADGLFELDAGPFNGDNGDLFPGGSLQSEFTNESQPSSLMNSGQPTEISVTYIREINSVIHFRLNDEATCSILAAVPGGAMGCGAGTYDQEIIVDYEFEPLGGTLSVNGRSFPITASPQTVLLEDIPADGQYHDLLVAFTEDLACSYTQLDAFKAPLAFTGEIHQYTCDPDEAGTQLLQLSTAEGCDSTVTLITEYSPSYAITQYNTTCSFDLAGTFVNTYSTAAGCDSVVTIVNEYLAPDTVVLRAATCDPDDAGVSVQHLVTAQGCDSIVRTETRLLDSYNYELTSYTCDPAEVSVETEYLQTAAGCDSTVTRVISLAPTYAIHLEETTCDMGRDGVEVLELQSQYGCDSTVTITRTLVEFQPEFSYSQDGRDIRFNSSGIAGGHAIWYFGDGSLSASTDPVHRFARAGLYTVYLFAWTDDCPGFRVFRSLVRVNEVREEIELEPVQPFAGPEMAIYPNPSFGPVHVEVDGFDRESAEMSLFDINGNVVYRRQLPAGHSAYEQDFSHIGPGVYLMQIATADQVATKKLLLTN